MNMDIEDMKNIATMTSLAFNKSLWKRVAECPIFLIYTKHEPTNTISNP
jgi:hypothetical protein